MWFKVDDQLHVHRKTKRLLRSAPDKRVDAAPMGLWVLAGSWAGQNTSEEGWVPEDELDRWDDNWPALVARLVAADFWWAEERAGEPGYSFVNWDEYKPSAGAASDGKYGNHIKWHVNRGLVNPTCSLCPSESVGRGDIGATPPPETSDVSGRYRGDDRGDIGGESPALAKPEPVPEPEPEPDPNILRAIVADAPLTQDADDDAIEAELVPAEPDRFDEWWSVYDKKVDRRKAEQKWRLALKKPGITPDALIGSARRYVEHQKAIGKHPEYTKNPTTWLNNESWNDDLIAPATNGRPRTSAANLTESDWGRFMARAEAKDALAAQEAR